ncbi:MAG: hypothetical protein M3069_33300 [Chloroflexota bacterium]|nr:hypothetical protein [Chloroflexota bacterium]
MKDKFRELIRRIAAGTGIPDQLRELSGTVDQLTQGTQAQLSQISSRLEDIESCSYVDRGTQILLRMKYRELAARGSLLSFDEVEFRNYSQNGEDGILLYVFSVMGESNKVCVEICAANGIQCNSANLIINHGWTGLLVDGNLSYIEQGQNYYNKHRDTRLYPPKFAHAWVTAENVNDLLISNGLTGEIDLLSLDIDGVDYWVWKAMTAVSPRVIIAEVQAIWKSEASVTVPYRADFTTEYIDGFGVYSGASLPAFVKLAKEKGYRLVGCQRYGFNAVFVRNDVGMDILPEIPAEDCFGHPFCTWAHDVLLPRVSDKVWVAV